LARVIRRNHIKLQTSFTGPRQVKVGFPAGKTDGETINKAIWNHYGTMSGETVDAGGVSGVEVYHIPPRPFLLNAIRKHRRNYLAAMKTAGAAILRGEVTLEQTMRKLGILAQGDIQQEITDLRDPPNAASTIAAKGSSNPLIDSGDMKSKVTWR